MKRALLIGCCLLALSGCGFKFIYNQLDWLIPQYLDDYISFTGEQRGLLERIVEEQLHWHRSTQLPDYADWLLRVNQDLQDGLARDELDYHQEALKGYWQSLMYQIAPHAASVLITVTDTQIEEFFTELEERNQDYRGDYVDLSPVKLRQKRVQRMKKHLKRWLGRLTPEQEQAVAKWGERFELIGASSLRYRTQWQVQLKKVLKNRHNGLFMEEFKNLMDYLQDDQPAEYRQKFIHNSELTKALLLQIDSLMTAKQRTHLYKELLAWAEDFTELAQGIN